MKWRDISQVLPTRTWLRLATAFGTFLVPVFLFVQLADEVQEQETLTFDVAVLEAINNYSSTFLDVLTVVLTQLGGVIGVTVIGIGLALLLWGRRKRRGAVILVIGVGGAALLNLLLKAFFQRDRPDLWERLVVEHSYSFPSGHAMASGALALSLIVIFWRTRWRWPIVSFAALYMVIIGLTRLYLGVHYPTDILAGWMVSAAWVATVAIVLGFGRSLRKGRDEAV